MKGQPRRTARYVVLCLAVIYVGLQLFVFFPVASSGVEKQSFVTKAEFMRRRDQEMQAYVIPSINLDDEIRKNLEYVRSIQDTTRKLIYVHIPKTAGTTIEEVGALQAKQPWGSCLFNHKPIRHTKNNRRLCKYPAGQFLWPTNIGYWHLPTQMYPMMGTNPYENADLFAVVRDPDERLLSEFYYICRRKASINWHGSACNKTRVFEPEYMNNWLQQKLNHLPVSGLSHKEYLHENGHFTPQYDFIVSSGDIRIVDYVLRMDNLQSEFPAMMKAYGIDAKMPENRRNAARNSTDLEATHFDKKTEALVHKIYEHDFELLQSTAK